MANSNGSDFRWLIEQLRKLENEKFHGKVEIKYHKGRATGIQKSEMLRPPLTNNLG